MFFRAPLIAPVAAVIHRLDTTATQAINPPGAPTTGYDPDFREPYPYEQGTAWLDTRVYMTAIRVPCQFEPKPYYEQARHVELGNALLTGVNIVLHRKTLADLGLLDSNQTSLLKKYDKITALEKPGSPGTVIKQFAEPLYVIEVRPGSWGMGGTGYDLEILFCENRPALPAV